MEDYEVTTRRGGDDAIRGASHFFMQTDAVYKSLQAITQRLQSLNVPYAVIGGMALVAHGYRRTTEDVDILVTPDDLRTIHDALVGTGYLPLFEGSKNLRDTQTGVRIEFLLAGGYPGDGKPKPVAFPDPSTVAVEIDKVRYASLPKLIELKLASGMTSAGRLRDLADVQELIRVLKLPDAFVAQLNPYVQVEFQRLAGGIRESSDDTKG